MFPLQKALFVGLVVALSAAAPAQAASTWYAAPIKPSSAPCSQQSPCSARYALMDNPALAAGDTVVLAGGDYDVQSIITVSKRISIEGATSGPRTHLIGSSIGDSAVLEYRAAGDGAAHITDIDAINTAIGGVGLDLTNLSGSTELLIDRVRGEGQGELYPGIFLRANVAGARIVLRNSVGRSTGLLGYGIYAGGPPSGGASVELRNVVADGRGDGSKGLGLSSGTNGTTCGTNTLTMKNTYVRSATTPAADLQLYGVQTCAADLKSFNSNWRDYSVLSSYTSVTSSNDQRSTDAKFADAGAGDYHQLPGSPTIDAGVVDDLIGPLDFDQTARIQDAAPDIGADEFTTVPTSDKVAPVGSALAFAPAGFVPDAGKSASATRKKKLAKGSTVSYKLSEAATVAFTVERKVKGRKKGKKCKTKRSKHGKAGKRCTIYKKVKGSFSRTGAAGTNSFHFTAVIGGKPLKRGSYRMSGAPTDGAGNHGAVFTGAFKILRR